jgi:hypothetical protein
MPIDLYYVLPSPPCRSVLLLAKALKIELNLKVTDLSKGENTTPEFLKVQYESLLLHKRLNYSSSQTEYIIIIIIIIIKCSELRVSALS